MLLLFLTTSMLLLFLWRAAAARGARARVWGWRGAAQRLWTVAVLVIRCRAVQCSSSLRAKIIT